MDWSLAKIIRTHARERGSRPMITCGERTITWDDMDARSNRVAQGFRAAGLAAQDRVAFIDKNGPEYFEVLFGGGKANVVNVAVNWRLAPAEMAYIVNDAAARLLFVGPDFRAHLDEIEGSLKTVEKIVVIGSHPRHESYDAWVARHPAVDPETPTAPEDVAMQLYTSGTTGLPKGAMLTNGNLGTLVPFVGPWWSFDETTINLVCMPLFHIGGSGWALVGMAVGCHSILFREFAPAEILGRIAGGLGWDPNSVPEEVLKDWRDEEVPLLLSRIELLRAWARGLAQPEPSRALEPLTMACKLALGAWDLSRVDKVSDQIEALATEVGALLESLEPGGGEDRSRLRLLIDRHGNNIPLVLAAYNAGSYQVERHNRIPPIAETQDYVARVLRFRQQYQKRERMAALARSS